MQKCKDLKPIMDFLLTSSINPNQSRIYYICGCYSFSTFYLFYSDLVSQFYVSCSQVPLHVPAPTQRQQAWQRCAHHCGGAVSHQPQRPLLHPQ